MSIQSFAQKQTAFWYFGEFSGLDFNSGNPIALTDSQMTTIEGCATMSSPDGELLMYTDGVTVWNKNHDIMQNGTNLNGNYSSTNSAIIIPKPDTDNLYYIFTVDHLAQSNGLQYSKVDMNLDNNLGSIIPSKKNIVLHTPTTEKITAVKHQNDIDWWVLAHKWNSQDFTAYLVTNAGIQNPIISTIGTNITGSTDNSVGAMKFSPDGKQIAIANSFENRQVQLFDFNDVTGIVSDLKTFGGFNGSATNVYGVEFSIDSKLLYVTDYLGSIYQFNTELSTESGINSSRIVIANNVENLGAIQIAPNGKIYVAKDQNEYLGVIENPNIIGIGCNYINNGIYLNGKKSSFGLPPFIQSYFWKEITTEFTCFGETTQFNIVSPEVSQVWDFDDPTTGVNNFSTITNPTHIFSAPGVYAVSVKVTNVLFEESTTIINVTIAEIPIASQATDFIICDDDTDNDTENGIIQSFLLTDKDAEIIGTLDLNQYDVRYYEDAAFTIPIDKNNPYENSIANTQLVYAKLFNIDNDTCFDMVQFNLVVNDVPIYDLVDEKVVCSNNLPDTISAENPAGVYDYVWTLDDLSILASTQTLDITSLDFIPDDGITITLTATNPINNCTTVKTVLVKKFEIALLTINDITIVDLTDNNTIIINPQDSNFNLDNYEFALDDTYGGIGMYQSESVFENVIPGVRTIYIRDIFGCDDFNLEVPIIGFPKFFTPNNDGENDTWHILGVSRNFYATSTIRIFDRYGKIVANILPQSEGWDGFYNNKKLPETDYWFTATLVDNNGNVRQQRGHFSLIRR